MLGEMFGVVCCVVVDVIGLIEVLFVFVEKLGCVEVFCLLVVVKEFLIVCEFEEFWIFF